MSNYKIALALIGGAAIGAAIGVLFAPDKGSQIRKNLSNSAKDFADRILSKAEEIATETESQVRGQRERSN